MHIQVHRGPNGIEWSISGGVDSPPHKVGKTYHNYNHFIVLSMVFFLGQHRGHICVPNE